jgi:hypothetical protein
MQKSLIYSGIILLIFLLGRAPSVAASYRGFNEVLDDQCVVMQDHDLKTLPADWLKYKGFIKLCELKKNKDSKSKVSLISIWTHDYLDSRGKKSWEGFPLPILVDDQFRQCGTLPELYPSSYVNSIYVSYGKWKVGIPTEIRIDVADPTVSGDYYYLPLLWDDKDKIYKMKGKERISGRRGRW